MKLWWAIIFSLVLVFGFQSNQNAVSSFSATRLLVPTAVQSRTVTLLDLKSNEESRFIENDIISRTASLVSYQCAEAHLERALASLPQVQPKLTCRVRGQLEEFVTNRKDDSNRAEGASLIDCFLRTLTGAITGHKGSTVQDGIELSRSLLLHAGDSLLLANTDQLPVFTPPTRTLIGTCDGLDISLLRDKEDSDSRFTLLFSSSQDRAKGRKMARLLAEMEPDGTALFIRGIFVNDDYRGKGLSTLLIAVLCQLCDWSFGYYPRTRWMNKPLVCASLASLGFTPESTQWPVRVAPHPTNPQVTLMSGIGGQDLGPMFPHSVRKAQQFALVEESTLLSGEGSTSREIHVLTQFHPPTTNELVDLRLQKPHSYQLYSARIVAFWSTFENGKQAMFQRRSNMMTQTTWASEQVVSEDEDSTNQSSLLLYRTVPHRTARERRDTELWWKSGNAQWWLWRSWDVPFGTRRYLWVLGADTGAL